MPRLIVTSQPDDPRQGVFVIDAPTPEDAFTRVMRDGQGEVVWSVDQPQFNERLIDSFGPAAKQRVRSFVTKLQGEFAGAGSVMLRETPLTRLGRIAGQFGKQAALPVAGGMVGGAVSPFFAIPSPVGSALGGAAGEIATKSLDSPRLMWNKLFSLAQSAGRRG